VVNNSSFGQTPPFPMLNNNPGWYDPQLQLQIFHQHQQQLLLQQQLQNQLRPLFENSLQRQHQDLLLLQHHQQQLLMSPSHPAVNNIRNNFPMSPPEQPQLNHFYQQQLLQQQLLQQQMLHQQLRSELESPFIPITHRSPFPENVSPLSQQKSPLNVALYLPAASNPAEKVSSDVLTTARPEQARHILTSHLTLPLMKNFF
jgi:hypothetical protein